MITTENKWYAYFADGHAEHTTWAVIKNGYEASFLYNGIATAVAFNKGGRLDYFIERYDANKLPVI